jgi:hypothetical protein
MQMDGVTAPEIARRINEPRSRVERILWSYRDRVPAPVRIGNARVWPTEVVDLVKQIRDEEARCAGGDR